MQKEFQKIKDKFKELQKQIEDPNLTNDLAKFKAVSREYKEYQDINEKLTQLESLEKSEKENQKIIDENKDSDLVKLAQDELPSILSQKARLEKKLNEAIKPQDPLDKKNVIVEIRAGTGGDEAALFAAELSRTYFRFAEKMGWKTSLIDANRIGIGGYKEVIFSVKGENVYGTLKYESGVHRVQRVPETEKAGRVHTSTVSVAVLPEAEDVDVKINPQDLRIDTFCSGGKGGQSVNTTKSAVRIVHVPTGLVVSCQDERSQAQNKERAMSVLRARLLEKQRQEHDAKISSTRKSQIGTADRSEKIRTYNFPQDRLTDHRIKLSLHNLPSLMDGEIDQLVSELKEKMPTAGSVSGQDETDDA